MYSAKHSTIISKLYSDTHKLVPTFQLNVIQIFILIMKYPFDWKISYSCKVCSQENINSNSKNWKAGFKKTKGGVVIKEFPVLNKN